MGANYLLHNFGEYKSTNFREMVLYTLKNQTNLFSHLRDISFSTLSLNDCSEWLKSDRGYIKQVENNRKLIKELKELMGHPEAYLNEGYKKYVEVQKSLQAANNSWYKDYAERINKNAEQFINYFNKLKKYSTGPVDQVLPSLEDAYWTAKAEENEALDHNKGAVSDMHKETIISFEEWSKAEMVRMENKLKLYERHLAEMRGYIRDTKVTNKKIIELFNILDKVDEEVKNDQNK